MPSSTARDRAVRPVACELYFLPVQTRVPLKFGSETLTSVVCARVKMTVQDRRGRRAIGWGETPLNVQWVWPSEIPYSTRLAVLRKLCIELTRQWSAYNQFGHPLEVGHDFVRQMDDDPSVPHLARLVCCSPFDIALHDAYGNLHGVGIYNTYTADWIERDLGDFFRDPAFKGQYPSQYLRPREDKLVAWHLVGGLDPLHPSELVGNEPRDGYPLLLEEWIRRDGLVAIKIKLRGNDRDWDLRRLVEVGTVALENGVRALSADFNCTAKTVEYVTDIIDALARDHPAISERLLYIEQPFGYELERDRIDVTSIASRKPLFLDESAHDWRMVQLGKSLGWNGVALKTCKTQSGAILSLCWARAHGMQIMVQDLTNPMLAMIPHALLAAHVGTIMGVETNACQFYPEASNAEMVVHPGLYQRREGTIELSSIQGPGFGYRIEEIDRGLADPAAAFG